MGEGAVTGLGHAGLRVDADGVRVLADPWLSTGGAFLGSWFPFPDNSHLLTPELVDVDVVVVSHEHLDHLDLELIAGLPDTVPVVVPRYPSTIMQRRLKAIGRTRIVVLDAWERYPLNARDWLTVIPEQCPMSHDAAVLLKVGERSILHTNDARISLAQARRAMTEVGGRLDVMGVQMSGASWHPVRYEYDEAERERISTIKRVGKFKAVTRLVRQVQPRLVMPYAGPPCFLDDDLFELNSGLRPGGIFPDQDEALSWLADRIPDQRGACLLPGDRIRLDDLEVVRDPHWKDFALDAGPAERRRYLTAYAERRRPAIDAAWAANPVSRPGLAHRFKSHVESLGTLSEYFLARIGMTLRFDVSGPYGGVWDAHIGPDRVVVDLDGGTGHADYTLTMDGRWLDGVVSGRTRWEELLLSLRFTARRQPDRYNDYLVGLLKHADRAALRAVERFEAARDPQETTQIVVEGKQLRVSRYCPHAGEDLAETGVVVNGVLRCLGHNFEFDLTDGSCLNARCDPVLVQQEAV
ncbi:MBL fold metallo-hydrolase [Kribbella sp.]|uniref:MBL fold metallo-hydrolase n=1 Tax=Kribbella sp. TaxID=1871183 RepID=UPI002D27D459|nr:MBL fold metallo-hydrolase [Kribbella sp.]HZX05375.1 MBL fold metallo-hydrolase [Kribbella sp.]